MIAQNYRCWLNGHEQNFRDTVETSFGKPIESFENAKSVPSAYQVE